MDVVARSPMAAPWNGLQQARTDGHGINEEPKGFTAAQVAAVFHQNGHAVPRSDGDHFEKGTCHP